MKLFLFSLILFHQSAFAFVLLEPKYELNDATKAKVMISSEGCTANGISDDAVIQAINWAIDFWNDVPESRLKLSYGGKSTASLTDSRIPKNQILVGCGALSSVKILGGTQHDRENGSARVIMNKDVYTGSYNTNSFIGTLTHEIGHGIGLFHSNDPASVMTYASHQWVDKPNYISQDDMDGVTYLYPNKSEVGGFLGSCSSFASDKNSNSNFSTDFLLGFISILGISIVLRKLLKRGLSKI